MRIALCVDVPKAAEIKMYDETLRLAKLAGSEAVPQVAIADDDVEGTQSPLGMKGNQCRANKRFTMLSQYRVGIPSSLIVTEVPVELPIK